MMLPSQCCQAFAFDPLTPGACLVHLTLLISPRKMHLSAWLLGHFGSCLHPVLSNSKEAKEPDLPSISKLVSERLFHFILFSALLHLSFPLLFCFSPNTIPGVWGEMERVKWKKIYKKKEMRYSTGDCGNLLIKACILIHPKACLMVYCELLCDH